ncbi:MAG: pectin-derived oligosaccharide transport system substrate-binding protein [Actinomycetota bacterium]|nr:pectin-derived oligosaccharide transport system substrate-binding protein [Actinomycetota bacterium]
MSGTTRLTRRSAAGALIGALLFTVSACGGSAGDDAKAGGPVEIRFSWWGNAERAASTQKAIDAFRKANPTITVKPEYTDFNGYFDRLATSVAAGNAPDVITLGGAWPGEYGARGALLDLSKVSADLNTADLEPAALENGRFDGVQYGVPTGVNTYAAIIDPAAFATAGVPVPDGDAWTWDDFAAISGKLAKGLPKGSSGTRDPSVPEALDAFSRQHNAEKGVGLYTVDGKLGITESTLVTWWKMTTAMRDAGATPPASVTAESVTQTGPEQTLLGRGLAGIQLEWSNQLGALRKASGKDLKLVRLPGEGTAANPGMWLQASQLYTINARSKHPAEAARLVSFLTNDAEAARAILTDRGVPTNKKVLATITPLLTPDAAAQAEFVASLSGKAGYATPGPKGSTDTSKILQRLNADVLFNRLTPETAAKQFTEHVTAAISK